ncbi:hypothetical protein VCHA53P481_140065 [Vibrio chagasii]|nr:hypothetical protein VCHA32P90_130065 [Vibrio chagasii]CAH6810648.1 hypothetical protein VCHA35O137_130057 [Vibrio chagasii]CAH6815779.1 hypothetical protein VCHA34P117_130106 [Vibrio chagasii]CAH6855800.1 hypothetical protein VCHA36P161_10387 [Vibrio chagasii]CAH6913868.1 hypothetical protein VCHA37O173_30427 [Vibrio chagasii]
MVYVGLIVSLITQTKCHWLSKVKRKSCPNKEEGHAERCVPFLLPVYPYMMSTTNFIKHYFDFLKTITDTYDESAYPESNYK